MEDTDWSAPKIGHNGGTSALEPRPRTALSPAMGDLASGGLISGKGLITGGLTVVGELTAGGDHSECL